MRRLFISVVLITTVTLVCLYARIVHTKTLDFKTLSIPLQHALLKQRLHQDHCFLAAVHDNIELIGRWTSTPNQSGKHASFRGSRARFSIQNSTSLFIALGPNPDRHQNYGPLSLNSADAWIDEPRGKVDVVDNSFFRISVGDEIQEFNYNGARILKVAQDLVANQTYEIELNLLGLSSKSRSVFSFEGVWLSHGGCIVNPTTLHSHDRNLGRLCNEDLNVEHANILQARHIASNIVEIVTPSSLVSPTAHNKPFELSYVTLLESSKFFDATVVALPLAPELCLVTACHATPKKGPHHPTISDLYFRSGPIHNVLFRYSWSWTSSAYPPSTLVFDIGLSDFHAFLKNERQDGMGKHNLEAFTTSFVAAFVNLILTIRRTTWHKRIPDQDTTFSYNSAPSDLNILIMVPVLPPTYNTTLARALYNGLHRVVTQLQTAEGDKSTFLVDTSGWLDDLDFDTPSLNVTYPPLHNQTQSPPTPNSSGHQKIAQFLALHLCPHLATQPKLCPFDSQHNYLGNLYLPKEAALGNMIEERKIERVKELIGGIDH